MSGSELSAENDALRQQLGQMIIGLLDEHWPNSGVNGWYLADLLRERDVRVTRPASEVWECGPHANAWNGHDARCHRVSRPGEPS